MSGTLKITYLALLLTFAVVIHTVEALFPLPFPLPGAKLGLANVITLLTLRLYGWGSGLVIAGGRSVLSSFFTGKFLGPGFMMSLTAGTISCVAMYLLFKMERRGNISIISVSVTGAVLHNVTQLTVAAIILQNSLLLQGYAPFLILIAIPTGVFTGLAAHYLEELTTRNLKRITYQVH